MILFDSLAGAMSLKSALTDFNEAIKQQDDKIIVPLPILNESTYRKNISIKNHKLLYSYWSNGGSKNLDNFYLFIKKKIFEKSDVVVDAPVEIPDEGIYHPDYPNLVFKTTKEYFEYFKIKKGDKPIIALAFHRASLSSNSMAPIDYTIRKLEKNDAVVLPYFTKTGGKDFAGLQFLRENNETIADVIISFQIMIINHESLKKDYKQLNIPILHAHYYRNGNTKEWLDDKAGVHFSMIPMTYIIPETLGFTDGLIVASQDKVTKEIKTIEFQMDSLIKKSLNMARLKRLKNKEKKVAIMFYNYPPGINNMGASFMNIPESLEMVFKNFVKEGYETEEKNSTWFEKEVTKTLKAYYESGHKEQMLEEGSAALFSYSEYLQLFNMLPQKIQDAVISKWGQPEDSNMIVEKNGEKYFLIPRIKVGNIIVMPQPRRADRKDGNITEGESDSNLWHNTNIAVNHAYLAAYLYVRQQFKADALIHFGTHGTQEWMPGKERGLSILDSPFLVLGSLPIFYPYITNNVAEAIQAKRRGRATLISHQTPPFGISGTYTELSEIMENIAQYKSVDTGMLKNNLKKMITDSAIKNNVHKDIGFTPIMIAEDFDKFVNRLEDYILGTAALAQPLGMHTYGTYPKDEHLITTVMQMLGKEFMKKADGERYAAKDYQEFNNSNAYKLLKKHMIDGEKLEGVKAEFVPYLQKAKEYANSFKNNKEIKNLFRALNGEYIESGVGGDPIRNPSSVPTGNNMYGFNPDKVPTVAAYKTGKKLMEDFIANFYHDNGKYPTKLTFNLWSLETMRHYGVLESQILYAMGVKPIWNEQGLSDEYIQSMALPMLKNYLPDFLADFIVSFVTLPRIEMVLGWLPDDMAQTPKKMIKHAKAVNKGDIIDVEIIPYGELKRPRVDVVISATGLYRDTFPQVMQLLAKAVDKVAKLKEDNNHVYINSEKIKQSLLDKNVSIQDALRLSTIRVFSNKTGTYGSGVSKLADTENFTAEADSSIAKDYLQERGYYFGADEKSWNQQIEGIDLYAQNLSGTEGIIFSRTSNLYALLTSDDPYGYFGAIALAIRDIDGKTPKSYISNLRDPNGAKMQSTAEFMSQELRSRYFHPKWIAEMKAEGYSGTQAVLDVVNNFWGWQVVDPDVVRDDQWQEFFEVYVEDKYNLGIKEWFEDGNPDNLAQIMERMLEAVRLGYWQADEATVKKLKERYKALEKEFNVRSYNEKFKELVASDKVSGFGLAKPIVAKLEAMKMEMSKKSKEVQEEPAQQVKGQKLEEVQVQKDKKNEWFFYLFLAFIMLSGMLYQIRKESH
jgi:cobaltochelatase CobN